MSENITKPTDLNPDEFIASLASERRRADGARLLEIMREVTGEEAVMWGPTMIGFGMFHYRYASGREGDTMKVGFSPRSTAISLYGLQGHARSVELLAVLGAHTLGKGCVYVKKLSDVNETVLRELIRHAHENAAGSLDS